MRTEEEMVAYALEVEPRLLPYVPELLADLEELGSDPELIAEVVADLDLASDTEVVDLGCGKGAVAVEIAKELGFKVLGIELFEPFIDSCNSLAAEYEVSSLCEFRKGNVLNMAVTVGQFEVAIFSALGDVLGRPDETVKVIREYVKPGGFIVISDVVLAEDGSNEFPGFESYLPHDETVALLTASGDELVREIISDAEDDEDHDEDEADKIKARAQKLATQHPEIKNELLAFADGQAQENDFVDANFIDTIWVLRKT